MKYLLWIVILLAFVLFGLGYLLFHIKLHVATILAYFLAINTTTFLYYGFDKLMAKSGAIRVPELLLHLLELLGGSPAALLSQQLFWHKSTKRAYQVVFWLIVLFQGALYYLIFHTELLKSIF